MSKQDIPINHNAKANWLRAAVLGSIDGIVSTAGVVVGVASATSDKTVVLIAGVAAVLAGALSMAAGEYVSVSTQRDIERKLHIEHVGHDEGGEFTNPWHAAVASAASFTIGSVVPMIAIMLPLGGLAIPATFAAVVVALVITGYQSAKLSGTGKTRAVVRVVIGGMIAMVATFSIGSLFQVQ